MKHFSQWLKISEYVAFAASVAGTIAATISNQVIYAEAPILLTIGLNIINRQKSSQINQLQNQSAVSKHDKSNVDSQGKRI